MCAAEGGRGKAPAVTWRERLLGPRAERAENCTDAGGGASTAGQHRRAGTRCRAPAPRLGATQGLFWQEEELLVHPDGVTIHRESQTHASLTTLQPLSLIFFNK